LEQGKNALDHERLDLEKAKFADEKYRFEAKTAQTYAGQVVQALLLLNGAAALAMLTFNLKSLLLGLSNPLSFFAHGAALAVLSAMFAYLSQVSWADKNSLWGNTLLTFIDGPGAWQSAFIHGRHIACRHGFRCFWLGELTAGGLARIVSLQTRHPRSRAGGRVQRDCQSIPGSSQGGLFPLR
jgi:hypothetical protein